MEIAKEKYPGVNGEIFQISVIKAPNTIIGEIGLVYFFNEQEKLVNLDSQNYPKETPLDVIIENTKQKIQLFTIIKRQTDIDPFKSGE